MENTTRSEVTFNGYTLHVGDKLHSDMLGNIVVGHGIKNHLQLNFIDKDSKLHDIAIDDTFNMHAKFVYEGLIPGIHVMFEWYDGNDCPTSVHLVDDITDEKSLVDILEKTFPTLVFTHLDSPDEWLEYEDY